MDLLAEDFYVLYYSCILNSSAVWISKEDREDKRQELRWTCQSSHLQFRWITEQDPVLTSLSCTARKKPSVTWKWKSDGCKHICSIGCKSSPCLLPLSQGANIYLLKILDSAVSHRGVAQSILHSKTHSTLWAKETKKIEEIEGKKRKNT